MKKFFKNQPLLKLLSLGMAIFLWMLLRAERKLETNLDVNLEVENLPENLVISREFESILQVRVVGPTSRVQKVKQDHSTTYKLDLKGAKRGSNTFWIHEEHLKLPQGVKVLQIIPQVVKVYLDRSIERQAVIVPKFIGALESGFELRSFNITPTTLKVRGTQEQLADLQKISTMPISLLSRRKSFEETVQLETLDRFLDVQDEKVTVKVDILEKRITKKIENVPILLVPTDAPWDTKPSSISIWVTGTAGMIADMDKNIEPYVDVSKLQNLPRSMIWAQPKIKPMPGLDIKILPERVEVYKRKRR